MARDQFQDKPPEIKSKSQQGVDIRGTGLPIRLARLREKSRLSQQELATKAGLAVQTIYGLESGRRERVRVQTLMLLSKALDVSYDDLLGRTASLEPALKHGGSFPSRWIWLLVSLILLFVFLGLRQLAISKARFIVEENRLIMIDGIFGWELWSKQHDSFIDKVATTPWAPGKTLAYGLDARASDAGQLYVIDASSGNLLWRDLPDLGLLAAVFGQQPLARGGFRCKELHFGDLDGDGIEELIAYFHHNLYFPSFIRIYRADGDILGTYCHFGLLYQIHIEDLDGDGKDELLVAGTNNGLAFQGATLFVLDDHFCNGAAVDPIVWPVSGFSDSSRVRVVLPKFEEEAMKLLRADRLEAYAVSVFRNDKNGLLISAEINAGDASFYITLDEDLRPLYVDRSDTFIQLVTERSVESQTKSRLLDPEYLHEWLKTYQHFGEGD